MNQATLPATVPAPGYTAVAKWFHWITVGLMAVALPFGLVIEHVTDADKVAFYAIHESAGLTILLVAMLRLLWRRANPPPPSPLPRLMHRAAAFVHRAFYVLLIVQPVLGFLSTNAWGFPMRGETAYLGLIDFPKFTEANIAVAEGLKSAHAAIGWTILLLLVVHIGAVVFHQAIRRDRTLLRMV